jgi:putative transposase
VAPDQIGGYRPKKLIGEYRDWLLQRCREGDFTLRGLVADSDEVGRAFRMMSATSFRSKPAGDSD